MKRAIDKLANLPDKRLFKEVAEGIPLIVKNAIELDQAAQCLYEKEQYRVSNVIRGFAEEEAAKVLILIDLIRCPQSKQKLRAETAKRFYEHVGKRIYAEACSGLPFDSFQGLSDEVKRLCLPYYSDGPNDEDWIFRNAIITDREQNLYVDYTQDETEDSGDCSWTGPTWPEFGMFTYITPDCVKLSEALLKAGFGSVAGLDAIAKIWRDFTPAPDTTRSELEKLIFRTLEQLPDFEENDEYMWYSSIIVDHWQFPMWSLNFKDPFKFKNDQLKTLREKRKQKIRRIEEIDARRDPPPAISRFKVEELTKAYVMWQQEIEEGGRHKRGSDIRSRIVAPGRSEFSMRYELPSYFGFKQQFDQLTLKERSALLALGWYAKQDLADWPHIYRRAIDYLEKADGRHERYERYEIAQASYWLRGMWRWQTEPKPFSAGQLKSYNQQWDSNVA